MAMGPFPDVKLVFYAITAKRRRAHNFVTFLLGVDDFYLIALHVSSSLPVFHLLLLRLRCCSSPIYIYLLGFYKSLLFASLDLLENSNLVKG